jgi:hypothetical protein
MGSEENSNTPASLVLAARIRDVSWDVTMTNALTTGRWDASITFPRTSAVLCPHKGRPSKPQKATTFINHRSLKHRSRRLIFVSSPGVHRPQAEDRREAKQNRSYRRWRQGRETLCDLDHNHATLVCPIPLLLTHALRSPHGSQIRGDPIGHTSAGGSIGVFVSKVD